MSAVEHVGEAAPRRPFPAARFIGLPVLGAVVGAVLALAFGGNTGKAPVRATVPPTATVAAGDLRLKLPGGWTPARKVQDLPGFAGVPKALARSWNADVTIALLPAVKPSLLPRVLGATKGLASSRPRVVKAGALRAYHYVGDTTADGVLEVVVVPTTQGVATIACASMALAPGECEPALRGLRLARGSFLPLSADAGFLSRLPAVAATLAAQRVQLRARLARASHPAGAARAAARLAGAYADAGGALRALAAPHSRAARTVRLLDGLRARYGRLADAVRTGDRTAFAATARAIGRDESRLAARLKSWQRAMALPGAS
jgi:hypothetical protein